MKIDPLIIGLVLLAALAHASWNALVKSDSDRLVTFGLMQASGMALALALVPWAGPMTEAGWRFAVASAIVHYVYYYLLLRAYAIGDLSHVYPIARGLGPFLVGLFSGKVVGEALSVIELSGVVLVSIGVTGLALARGLPRGADARATGFAILTGMTIATYTIIDGLGARVSGNPFGFIVWLNVMEGPGVLIIALMRRPAPVLLGYLRVNWWRGCLGGTIASAAYGVSIWAMSLGGLAHVAALRETSVLFAALIGALLLGERFGVWRVTAAAIILAGLLLMNLSIGR